MRNVIVLGCFAVAVACMYAFAYIVNFSSQYWWAGPTLLLCLACGVGSFSAAVARMME